MSYTLLGPDGGPYESDATGGVGRSPGHPDLRPPRLPVALRAIARGGYVRHRVFFADEATAIAAGYCPCAVCCPGRYRAWKAASGGGR